MGAFPRHCPCPTSSDQSFVQLIQLTAEFLTHFILVERQLQQQQLRRRLHQTAASRGSTMIAVAADVFGRELQLDARGNSKTVQGSLAAVPIIRQLPTMR